MTSWPDELRSGDNKRSTRMQRIREGEDDRRHDIERYETFLARLKAYANVAHATLNRREKDLESVDNLLKDLYDIQQVFLSAADLNFENFLALNVDYF